MAIVLLIRPAGLFGRADDARMPQTISLAGPAARCIVWLLGCCRGALVPFVVYPVFLMKVLCFALFACAFNLLLGYRRPAVLRPCRVLRLGGLRRRPRREGLGPAAGARDRLPAPPLAALLGVVFGWLAIRRNGIYFAMITLALAQMVYFFALQAPFTGGGGRPAADPARHICSG